MPDLLQRLVARLGARAGWYPFLQVRSGPGRGLWISLRNASADYVAGTNELPVQEAVATHLRPGGVFYDIGSNIGFFALLAGREVGPAGHAYAFEPVPANVERIRANATRNRLANVTALQVAASDGPGSATLLLSRHPGGAALAAAAPAPADLTGEIEVQTVSIDQLVAADAIQPPTVVKVDVEGNEAPVLRGMAATIRTSRPVLVIELDDAAPERLRAKANHIAALLDELEYDMRPLPPSYEGTAWHVMHALALPKGEAS